MNLFAFALSIVASVHLLFCLWIFGRKKPNYHHLRHTISELVEIGAPQQRQVSWLVFLPVGLLMLVVAYLVQALATPLAALALCISIGYVVAAFFPCDVGSPLTGSNRQSMHNLGGTVEYIGGALVLLELAERLGPLFRIAGYFVLAAGLAISVPQLAAVRGFIQRIAECCLFGGLVLAIWRLGVL